VDLKGMAFAAVCEAERFGRGLNNVLEMSFVSWSRGPAAPWGSTQAAAMWLLWEVLKRSATHFLLTACWLGPAVESNVAGGGRIEDADPASAFAGLDA
jgi:hypothetical protein